MWGSAKWNEQETWGDSETSFGILFIRVHMGTASVERKYQTDSTHKHTRRPIHVDQHRHSG